MSDYIDRQALLEEIERQKRASKTAFPKQSFVVGDVIVCIKAQPAADVRPVVRGEWVLKTDDLDFVDGKCSVCGYTDCFDESGLYNFCPNCSRDMRGTSDDTP